MAHRSRASSPILHRKKLFGGRETAQEVHRRHAWAGGRCYRCGSGTVVAQLSYHQSPLDLTLHEPKIVATLLEASEDHQLPIWKSKYGPMVLYWVEYTCSAHQKETEVDAARLPSYILVEIDRGVGEDKIVLCRPALLPLRFAARGAVSDPFQPLRLLTRVRTRDGVGVVVASRAKVEANGSWVGSNVIEDEVVVWYDGEERNKAQFITRTYRRADVVVLG